MEALRNSHLFPLINFPLYTEEMDLLYMQETDWHRTAQDGVVWRVYIYIMTSSLVGLCVGSICYICNTLWMWSGTFGTMKPEQNGRHFADVGHLAPWNLNKMAAILQEWDIWHHEAWTKWLPFCRRHIQMYFLEWKAVYFDANFN